MLEKLGHLVCLRRFVGRDDRKIRATRSGTGLVDARCSKNSGISSVCGASWAEMIEKFEQLDRERAPWTRDDRKIRATRSGTCPVDARCSKNSGISSVYGASWAEMIEKFEQLDRERAPWARDARKNRATRSGTCPVDARCSKKSSNSIGNVPRGPEMLEKFEQLDRERAPWTRDARKNRATRSGTCPVDARCSKKSSNSIGNGPRGPEMLEKLGHLVCLRRFVGPGCSKKSSNSTRNGPRGPGMIEKIEHFVRRRASRVRVARESRATRPGTGRSFNGGPCAGGSCPPFFSAISVCILPPPSL